MYLEYWSLQEFPFENVPDPKFIFYSPEYEEALVRLIYAVQRKKGCALLTGELGCGKTTLSRVLIQKLMETNSEIGLITNPNLNPMEFLKEIMLQLGLNPQTNLKVDLLNMIKGKILENEQNDTNTILIIDEAQLIPRETFEEIRLMLNFQLNDKFLITLILIGEPELRDIINKIPQLEQRIAIKYHLKPLTMEEMRGYIISRLQKAGAERVIFTEDALREIFQGSGGIPRRINNICDMSLLIGSVSKVNAIEAGTIRQIIRDINGES
jgi:general secretion pathway protein A